MPELPEVETIKRQLCRTVKGAVIYDVKIKNTKLLRNISKESFIKKVRGAKIKDINRRAKLLVFSLSNKKNILFHLKMTGRMLLADKKEKLTKHTHIIFELSGNKNLFFKDYRKFGFVALMDNKQIAHYFEKINFGPEPLSPNFTYKTMKACLLAKPNKKIKQLLMEPDCIAGIGNIYASEICFYAGIRPERRIKNIKEKEFEKIYKGTKQILRQAIKSGGTSSKAYVDAYGEKGQFVPKLKVYARENKKCVQCGKLIKKIKLGGRGTFFCPNCQK